jgi:hypothetical protein
MQSASVSWVTSEALGRYPDRLLEFLQVGELHPHPERTCLYIFLNRGVQKMQMLLAPVPSGDRELSRISEFALSIQSIVNVSWNVHDDSCFASN